MRCKCKNGLMERSVKPEHVEDLGGLIVKVLNAVVVQRCSACGDEMIGIPDLQGLAEQPRCRAPRFLSVWREKKCDLSAGRWT